MHRGNIYHRLANPKWPKEIDGHEWRRYVLREQLEVLNKLALKLGEGNAHVIAARLAHSQGDPYGMSAPTRAAQKAAAQL
jgi:hypothetical protein